jgi:outer membrane murein-binding lipoprotein Lpp
MKKLFILSVTAALFAACSSAPKVSESATKVSDLTSWVDSVKGLVSTATDFNAETWEKYSADFNSAMEGINVEELDEASKATLEGLKTTWEGVGESYSSGIENVKKQMEEAAANQTDSAGNMIDQTMDAAGNKIEEVKAGANEMKAGADKMVK